MQRNLRIDWIAPPFAGHLYPILEMAHTARQNGWENLRVLSTSSARPAIEAHGMRMVEMLPGKDAAVQAIANPQFRVGSNPLRLIDQLQQNLALMEQFQSQLRSLWSRATRPDLVIADFTLPVAGLTAKSMGIAWWTALATPCALETGNGVPSYLGGWRPRKSLLGRQRDRLGRSFIRTFKKSVGWLFKKHLKRIGIDSLYRNDRLEAIYSDECILAYGTSDFEFAERWPNHVHFIGPWTAAPPNASSIPTFHQDRDTILVTVGTHLKWARKKLLGEVIELARKMPEYDFHFTHGNQPCEETAEIPGNLLLFSFIPYQRCLHKYRAAIAHGGTGITYACIEAGIPMLVWPQDFDQFDHAARIDFHGLGIWCRQNAKQSEPALRKLLANNSYQQKIESFRERLKQLDGKQKFIDLLRRHESSSANRNAMSDPNNHSSGHSIARS